MLFSMLISDLGKGVNIEKMELMCSDHRIIAWFRLEGT